MPIDLEKYIFLAEEDIHKHSGLVRNITNSWWCVTPGKGLMFYLYNKRERKLTKAAPQCNSNESVARRLQQITYPGVEVKFFPSVLVPIDPREYA